MIEQLLLAIGDGLLTIAVVGGAIALAFLIDKTYRKARGRE